jgi:tetratricopeptide (TPR) repeat protein
MSESTENVLAEAMRARREYRHEDARRDLLQLIKTLRDKGPQLDLASALRELGETERRTDPASARQYYEEAITILRTLNAPVLLAHAIRHLGDVLYESGEAPRARSCHHEALTIYRQHPEASRLELANAIRSLAVSQSSSGDKAQAIQLWQEARALYRSLDIEAGVNESTKQIEWLQSHR